MPPRRSARVAAVVERQCTALAPLPHALVLFIFSLVPVDQRLRCLEVCKGWYAMLNERSFWTRLDLSATAGLARPTTDALLRAAAARAPGQLQALFLTDGVVITHDALLAVVRANADTLTELRMEGGCRHPYADLLVRVGQVEAVLGAAPRLRVLAADVSCYDVAEAHRLLRNEGVLAAVRVRKLRVTADAEADILALAADLAAHACLTDVHLYDASLHTLAALDAVVDAALALQLASLTLLGCNVTPASAPALARLMSSGALTELYVWNGGQEQLLDQPAAALIADALRANSTLTSLKLQQCRFWEDAAGAALMLGALTAHRSLRMLDFHGNVVQAGDQQAPALGAALGALVAANARALHELDLSYSGLEDALPLNTHLRTLNLHFNYCSNDFVQDRLLPAVRANASLRKLVVGNSMAAREAQALVERRAAA